MSTTDALPLGRVPDRVTLRLIAGTPLDETATLRDAAGNPVPWEATLALRFLLDRGDPVTWPAEVDGAVAHFAASAAAVDALIAARPRRTQVLINGEVWASGPSPEVHE